MKQLEASFASNGDLKVSKQHKLRYNVRALEAAVEKRDRAMVADTLEGLKAIKPTLEEAINKVNALKNKYVAQNIIIGQHYGRQYSMQMAHRAETVEAFNYACIVTSIAEDAKDRVSSILSAVGDSVRVLSNSNDDLKSGDLLSLAAAYNFVADVPVSDQLEGNHNYSSVKAALTHYYTATEVESVLDAALARELAYYRASYIGELANSVLVDITEYTRCEEELDRVLIAALPFLRSDLMSHKSCAYMMGVVMEGRVSTPQEVIAAYDNAVERGKFEVPVVDRVTVYEVENEMRAVVEAYPVHRAVDTKKRK